MFHSFQLKGPGLYIAGSGSISGEHPVRMSEAITERLRLRRQPGSRSSFKNVCTKLAAIRKKEPGARAVYAGPCEEDRDAVDILDSLESHDAMAAVAEKIAPIHAAMGPHLAAPSQIHNVAFNPSALTTLLEGEMVQMITIEGVSVEVKGSEVRTVLTALRSCSTFKGVEVRELVGETKPEEANRVGRTIVVVAGWQDPVSWEDEGPTSAEWWTKEAAKLGPGQGSRCIV